LPIAAALGLFAMLGVGGSRDGLFAIRGDGPHTDVFAHLFGLGVGCLVGLIAARAHPRRPGLLMQGVLVAGTVAVISGSWWLAFHR
jgi:membrane associated rhomboid family serine protease